VNRIDDPQRAQRLARAILSDILTYHPAEVRAGIEADDVFERLAGPIEEARAYFESRVTPELARKSNAFGRALVDVLVYRSRHVASRIW